MIRVSLQRHLIGFIAHVVQLLLITASDLYLVLGDLSVLRLLKFP